MKYANAVFDVDGTLFDTWPGVRVSLLYAYEKLGVPAPDEETLRTFIGPSLHDSFARVSGFDLGTREKAIALFRSVYSTGNYRNADFMPGMERLLKELAAAGVTLTVATNKPYPEAVRLFEYKGLGSTFQMICAPDGEGRTSDKAVLVAKAAAVRGPALMIGDRKYDLEAARAAGIDSVGVTFGFGSKEELTACRPTYLANNAAEIAALILGNQT